MYNVTIEYNTPMFTRSIILYITQQHNKIKPTWLRPSHIKLVLSTFCSERDGRQKVLSKFKILDVVLNPFRSFVQRSGSLYYVQVVRTQFEPIL